jgi:hypothetical protein
VAAVHKPGLIPTKSSLRPGPTRTGTETLRKDCNSAWVKPTLVTVVGKLQWAGGAQGALLADLGRRLRVSDRNWELNGMSPVSLLP